MKKIGLKWLSLIVISLFAWQISFAASSSPVPKLQNTANTIISQLKKNRADLRSNPKISYRIVTRYLLPLVAQEYMARSVLTRSAWMKASNAQKQAFIKQFRTLVVRTYASAIAQFTDETVKFMPVRGGIDGRSIIQVQSFIIQPGRPKISVNYQMTQSNGQWKIIDFSVDGISMVQSFRSQFAPQLSQGGLSSLIQKLQAHNARNA